MTAQRYRPHPQASRTVRSTRTLLGWVVTDNSNATGTASKSVTVTAARGKILRGQLHVELHRADLQLHRWQYGRRQRDGVGLGLRRSQRGLDGAEPKLYLRDARELHGVIDHQPTTLVLLEASRPRWW
jgi:hypothetical protein